MFQIRNYSAFRRAEAGTFGGAVKIARRFADQTAGGLPATITDGAGRRWVVWYGVEPRQEAGPILEAAS